MKAELEAVYLTLYMKSLTRGCSGRRLRLQFVLISTFFLPWDGSTLLVVNISTALGKMAGERTMAGTFPPLFVVKKLYVSKVK